MCVFKMFFKTEKVVRVGKKWSEGGKNGVKSLSQTPHKYTTTNVQCPKSEAALTVHPKSVSCSKQVYQNRLACEN